MNILNNIIEVNGDLGFSVQGTANCKALGFARNIAQAKTLASVTPTVDSRSDWEDEQTGKAVAIVHSKQNGHSEQRDPDLEIAKWCYVIRMLGLEQPSLEGSVKFLEENAGPKVSRKDFDDLVEEVMDEFTGKDKETKARVTQYYVERTITPKLYVWPAPENSTDTLISYRWKRIQDVNAGAEDIDIPSRFMPCLVTGLAFNLALKKNPEKAGLLQPLYEQNLVNAIKYDDDGSLHLVPRRTYV